MKKVLFVSTMIAAPWGGSEELITNAAFHLLEQEIDLYLCCPKNRVFPKKYSAVEKSYQQIIKYSPDSRKTRRLKRFRLIADEKKEILNISPDLILILDGVTGLGLPWMTFARENKIPYATLTTCNDYFTFAPELREERCNAYQNAVTNFFVSKANVKNAERSLGIDIAKKEQVVQSYNVDCDSPFIWPKVGETYELACVAVLDPIHKGQDLIFEVLDQEKWAKRNIRVTLYGKGRSESVILRLKEVFPRANVEFAGFSSDVDGIWSKHHALLLPSRFEAGPIVTTEAMLLGRVPIVTAVGGNPEYVDDGDSGFLIPSATPALVDETLEKAWELRAEWEQIGQNAYNKIREVVPKSPEISFANQLLQLI